MSRSSSSSAAKESACSRPGHHAFVVSGTRFELPDKYEYKKPIGHGAYGVVVSAVDKETGKKVAIKKVPKAFEDLIDAKRILREIKLLRHFEHENIIALHELLMPPSLRDFVDVYIINDLMETDLHRIIYSRQALTDDHVQYFVYQLLRSLKYMHSAEVLHRDLKPSNLLLNSNCDLKVCDFGLARGVARDVDPSSAEAELTEYVVTRWYRAPEIMLSCQVYSKAIDMWSVGCIFAELLGRKPLFPGEDYIHQLQIICDVLGSPTDEDLHFVTSEKAKRFMRSQRFKPKRPFSTIFRKSNAKAIDLLEKMLVFDPAKRISVEEALAHPYMESLHNPEDEPTAGEVFDFSFEKLDLDKRTLQRLIYEEALVFHPELRPEYEERVRRAEERRAARGSAAAAK
jgi:mitogen-activated protein kinase 1/3